jgi:hypothetical protein
MGWRNQNIVPFVLNVTERDFILSLVLKGKYYVNGLDHYYL